MPKYAVVTDSASALSASVVQSLRKTGRFEQVDLPVFIGGQPLSDSQNSAERIALAHVQGQLVTTSAPSTAKLADVYAKFQAQGFDAIFSVHISSQLSSTVNTARNASREVDIPVYVIDTQTVAMAQGLVVLELVKASAEGLTADELADYARDIAENTRLFFYVPTLDALRRGGRIHPALAKVGQMFQIRPVATVNDGKLVYLERPRTIPKAKERLLHHIETESKRPREGWEAPAPFKAPSGRVVAVHYCGNGAEAKEFAQHFADPDIAFSPLPDVLAAHTGIGVLAAVTF